MVGKHWPTKSNTKKLNECLHEVGENITNYKRKRQKKLDSPFSWCLIPVLDDLLCLCFSSPPNTKLCSRSCAAHVLVQDSFTWGCSSCHCGPEIRALCRSAGWTCQVFTSEMSLALLKKAPKTMTCNISGCLIEDNRPFVNLTADVLTCQSRGSTGGLKVCEAVPGL